MIAAAGVAPPLGVAQALRRAVRDFYEESLRFVVLNCVVSAWVLFSLTLAFTVPVGWVLVLGAGPLAAALVSAAVTLVQEGSLNRGDVLRGLRRSWRRGLVLGTALALVILLTVVALGFYAGAGSLAWPLAVLILYLAGIFGVYQLLLWPLAIRDVDRPLREVVRDAGLALVRRPGASTGLAVALLLVNLAGLAAAVLPFLTMTISYSAIAATRFALPPTATEEA